MNKFLFYLPRILSVIIVLFFGLFILEGFSPEFNWGDSLMHLILTLVILGVVITAWTWPKIGGWLFILPGLYFLIMFLVRGAEIFSAIISGVFLTTGVLFLVSRNSLKKEV